MQIAPNVHLVKNSFVNLYLIDAADGLTLIDTGIARSGPKGVLNMIQSLARAPRDLRHILITHADGDHTGGLAQLLHDTGARVYARQPEVAAIQGGTISRQFKGGALSQLGFKLFKLFAPIKPAQVDVLLHGGEMLPVAGGAQVLATPGHTPGHTSFYLIDSGVLFAGDSMNSLPGPLTWKPAAVHWDYEGGKASVARQAELGARWVCCGHGKPVPDPVFPRF